MHLPAVTRCFVVFISLALAGSASAISFESALQTLVSDSFSAPDGSIEGRSPEGGLATGTWGSGNNRLTSIEEGRVRIDSTESLDISIGGLYAPGVLEVSGFLDRNNLNGGIWDQIRGVGLGFRSDDFLGYGGEGWAHFRGIVLRADGGLGLVDTAGAGLPPNPDILLARGVPSSGVLSYKIDTTTGDIYDIFYAGLAIDDPATTNFTTENVTLLSAYSVGISGDRWGYVDDLLLLGTPFVIVPPAPTGFLPRVEGRLGGDGTGHASNLRALAAGLDATREGASGELAALIGDLDGIEDDAELARQLGELSPARLEAANRSILHVTSDLHQRIHVNTLRGMEIGATRGSARHAGFRDALRAALPDVAAGTSDSETPPVETALGLARWHAFVEGLAGYGTEDSHDGRVGQRWWTTGFLGGIDYALRDDFVLGMSAAYGYTDAGERGGDASGNVHTGRLGPYLGFARGGAVVDAGLSFGFHAIDDDRRVLGATARSDHDAWDVAFHSALRFDFARGSFRFGPVTRMQFVHLDEDGYTESGGGGAALRIGSRETQSLTSTLGGHLSWAPPGRETDFQIEAELGWVHEYLDDAETLGARFASDPASGFRIRLPEADRNAVRASLGASLAVREDLEIQLGWEGTVARHSEEHTGSVRLEYAF